MLDEHRGEALLVLDLHGIEDAAVGINADKETVGRSELPKDESGIVVGHGMKGGRRAPRQICGGRVVGGRGKSLGRRRDDRVTVWKKELKVLSYGSNRAVKFVYEVTTQRRFM